MTRIKRIGMSFVFGVGYITAALVVIIIGQALVLGLIDIAEIWRGIWRGIWTR